MAEGECVNAFFVLLHLAAAGSPSVAEHQPTFGIADPRTHQYRGRMNCVGGEYSMPASIVWVTTESMTRSPIARPRSSSSRIDQCIANDP
jgi:hypothetical protein